MAMANMVFGKSKIAMLLLISVLLFMYSGCNANEAQEEDAQSGSSVLLKAASDATGQELAKLMEETQSILQKRAKLLHDNSTVTIREEKYVLIQFPEEYGSDTDAVFGTDGTSKLQFMLADGTEFATMADVKGVGIEKSVNMDDDEGYSVSIVFTKEGAEKLLAATKKASSHSISEDDIMPGADGAPLAMSDGSTIAPNSMVVMIDNQVAAAPSVDLPIESGEAIIDSFSRKDALGMAIKIQGDMLPLPLSKVE
jgi:preprotein translocase subunit SecD